MKIYVAGKITGLDRAAVEAKFEKARAELTEKGHSVFVPTVLPDLAEIPHQDYLHICCAMIDVCDAVYMLPDWRTSAGARQELQYAADFRKKIIYEDKSTREDGFPILHGHPEMNVVDLSRIRTSAELRQ